MSWLKGDKVTAEDFVTLKEKVKAELARRQWTGSVKEYATDYTDIPQQKGKIKKSHITEIVNTLNKINNVNYNLTEPIKIQSLSAINDLVEKWSKIDKGVSSLSATGCKSSCTGLCLSLCHSCSGTCSTTCASSCYVNNCTNGCTNACTGCTNACQSGCSNNCSGSSVAGCSA